MKSELAGAKQRWRIEFSKWFLSVQEHFHTVLVRVCARCVYASPPQVYLHRWAYQPNLPAQSPAEVGASRVNNAPAGATIGSSLPPPPNSQVPFQRSEKTELFCSFKRRRLGEGTVICHWEAETWGVFWAIDSRRPKPFQQRERQQEVEKNERGEAIPADEKHQHLPHFQGFIPSDGCFNARADVWAGAWLLMHVSPRRRRAP